MANEKRGEVCEVLTVLALHELGYKLGRNLHWLQTPHELSLCQTDVSLGADPNNPQWVLQVNASGYAGNYQMKFWRDVGELLEVKLKFPDCRVASLHFAAGIKPRLSAVYSFLADGTLDLPDIVDGHQFLEAASKIAKMKGVPSDRGKLLPFVAARTTPALLAKLAKIVGELLATKTERTWTLHHQSTDSLAPLANPLNLRHALLDALLFVVDSDLHGLETTLENILSGKPLSLGTNRKALVDLGVVRRSISGVVCTSLHLRRAVTILGVSGFLEVLRGCLAAHPKHRLFDYIQTIHAVPYLSGIWLEILKTRAADYVKREGLLERDILENFHSLNLLIDTGTPTIPEPWIVRRLLDLLRTAAGKHQYVGTSAFDREAKRVGVSPIRFSFPEYIAGRKQLAPEEAAVLSQVLRPLLELHLKEIASLDPGKYRDQVYRSEYNQRLRAYRSFRPVRLLSEMATGRKVQTAVPALVKTLDISGACTSDLIETEGRVVMWQSASSAGVDHKVKECAGRMGLHCLRVTGAAGAERFSYDAVQSQRVLYIDGDWVQEDIAKLRQSVFTEVLNPLALLSDATE